VIADTATVPRDVVVPSMRELMLLKIPPVVNEDAPDEKTAELTELVCGTCDADDKKLTEELVTDVIAVVATEVWTVVTVEGLSVVRADETEVDMAEVPDEGVIIALAALYPASSVRV
jgi:hypothetical protein